MEPTLESAYRLLDWLFGGDYPRDGLRTHQACARALLVYCVGIALVRAGKSRLISRANSVDVIVGFLLGSLLSRGITGYAALSTTFAASAAIVAAHWLLTRVIMDSKTLGGLFKGHSVPLIQDGELCPEAMQRSHISERDLLETLRLAGVESPSEVKRAYKERCGEISVIRQ
jgi:uncharacterized membrane protein YcaP (DUF421 family)